MSGSESGQVGFDQVSVPDGDGGSRLYTRRDFEELPLADRVRLLMNGKTKFFRNGVQISARDALQGR
jgi:hypothetical protein